MVEFNWRCTIGDSGEEVTVINLDKGWSLEIRLGRETVGKGPDTLMVGHDVVTDTETASSVQRGGKRANNDVNLGDWDSKQFTDTSTRLPKRTNG
ncbi:hypothetical protein WICPIJ_000910 [Wickerhamomyces pijperi]|uniref:Uncharacterized protein n=1 Tax=Wickerhamomyces pijperi TaxID=599730 RepID=A0A9P8QF56_WICPI|nr:hypothetical protein WICPIJ_000910 [Wickerhamomyces pijperi]